MAFVFFPNPITLAPADVSSALKIGEFKQMCFFFTEEEVETIRTSCESFLQI